VRHVADGVVRPAAVGVLLGRLEQALRLAADRRLGVDDAEENLLLEMLSCPPAVEPAPPGDGAASGVAAGADFASVGVLAHAGSAETLSSNPASKTDIRTVAARMCG
jgi:hypothetical protein